MSMKPGLRAFMLTAHTVFSVGWFGAVVAYLILAIAGLTSNDAQMVRAAYLSMELIGWYVIVPISLVAFFTGLVQSIGTQWGVFRHYWIVVKLLLTISATAILFHHMQTVSQMSDIAAGTALTVADFRPLRIQLVVHAGGGLLVLLVITALSVYKPWGITAYGRRKQNEKRKAPMVELPSYADTSDSVIRPDRGSTASTPRWVYIVGFHAIGLFFLLVILHLAGIAPQVQ